MSETIGYQGRIGDLWVAGAYPSLKEIILDEEQSAAAKLDREQLAYVVSKIPNVEIFDIVLVASKGLSGRGKAP